MYEESFVSTQFTYSGKRRVVGFYILSRSKVRLYGFDGVLLLSVQIQADLAETKMLKVEWVSFAITVECSIVYQIDYDACR